MIQSIMNDLAIRQIPYDPYAEINALCSIFDYQPPNGINGFTQDCAKTMNDRKKKVNSSKSDTCPSISKNVFFPFILFVFKSLGYDNRFPLTYG